MKTFTLTLLLAASLIGCKKSDIQQAANELAANPMTYKGYMRYTANGFYYNNEGSIYSSPSVMMRRTLVSSTISPYKYSYAIVSTNQSPFNLIGLDVFADSLKVGTYELKALTGAMVTGLPTFTGKDTVTYDSNPVNFYVNITKNTGKIVEGTFSGFLFKTPKAVQITNGSFSCGCLYN